MSARYNRKKKVLEILLRDNPQLRGNPQALVEAYEQVFSQDKEERNQPKRHKLNDRYFRDKGYEV